jgi:Fe-S-cluster containining protein
MLHFDQTFKKYEILVEGVDQAVKRIGEAHSECLRCAPQCSDCCHAIFDLSLIESVYINYRFYQSLEKSLQDRIIERAERADRQAYRLKRRIQKMLSQGEKTEGEVLSLLAEERLQCPFLNESDLCDGYNLRPITCRAYGLTTIIHGAGYSCGKSGFTEGGAYQSINLDRINQHLGVLSEELLAEIGSPEDLKGRLVPLSSALLTDYDKDYFGLKIDCSVEG